MPGPAPRRRSALKAAAILEGAKQEFLQRGYAAASMDRIAAAAQVSKATVYSHYGDKASLFSALSTAMVQRRMEDVFQNVPEPDATADPAAVLVALASRILAVRHRQGDMLDFLRLVIGESGRFPELARGFAHEVERHILKRVVGLFRPLGEAPELKARIFIGTLMHTILFQEVLHGGPSSTTANPQQGAATSLAEPLVALLLGMAPSALMQPDVRQNRGQ